jgi:fermentation-respiration switch protein FrsA (DUF1100 family)
MVDSHSTVPTQFRDSGHDEASYIFAVWNLVIRPPRCHYETSQLGPIDFEIATGVQGQRRDLRLRTKRGLDLVCSHFVPRRNTVKGKNKWNRMPVVIYMHGNSSSRLEAGSLVAKLLEKNISLFCFDWAGCGQSEGEYISLGWYERDDLASVVEHLRQSMYYGPIGLWGRSMGAVSALMHVERDASLAAMCVDSPFMSLRLLIEEVAKSDRLLVPVPTWLVNAIYNVIRNRVQALADFDINDIVPLDHGARSLVPAMFMHGRGDTFIAPRHSEELYSNYGGHKEIMFFDGDHNSERSDSVLDRSVDFLCRSFRKYELEQSVAQHLADAHFSVPVQDGLPHRIPHLPRASGRRKALGDVTNVATAKTDDQAAATSAEAASKDADDERRPAPRKFAPNRPGRGFSSTPPRQPDQQRTPSSDGSPTENPWVPRNRSPEVLLTNRVYPSKVRSSVSSKNHRGADKENSAPRQAACGGA